MAMDCVQQLPTDSKTGIPLGGLLPDVDNVDEKVKFVTQTGDKINMLWPGRRYALPFKNVIIDKFTQKTGMPHHSLLPNLSVFLRPDDMAVYNELQQLTMDWKGLDESTKDSTMKSMDTIMGKAMWGFWNVSNDNQISSADAATMDDLNYPDDGFTELSAYILDDDELSRVLSSNMKSLKQVNDMHTKLIDNKWKADTNSMYHDDSFAQVMKKYPHIVCRIYQVECEDEETTCESVWVPVRVSEMKKTQPQTTAAAQVVAGKHHQHMTPKASSKTTRAKAQSSDAAPTVATKRGRSVEAISIDATEPAVLPPPAKKSKYAGLTTIAQCVQVSLQVLQMDTLPADKCPIPSSLINNGAEFTVDTLNKLPPQAGQDVIAGLRLLIANGAYKEVGQAMQELESHRKAAEDYKKAAAEHEKSANALNKQIDGLKSSVKELNEDVQAKAKKIEKLEEQLAKEAEKNQSVAGQLHAFFK